MAGKLVEVTADNFGELTAKGTVLLDFWATWCGPCRMQTPILEEVAGKIGDAAVIGKVDVDSEPALAAKFGVRSIPTLVLFKDGAVKSTMVGLQQADALIKAIKG